MPIAFIGSGDCLMFSYHYNGSKHGSRGMLGQLFTPREVKWTLSALDELERSAANSAFSSIKKDVQTRIRDANKTKSSIRIDRMKPEGLAALLTSNVIQAHLCSGTYHTYRGVLTFGGEQLLKLWDFVIETMTKTGVHTQEEADDEKMDPRRDREGGLTLGVMKLVWFHSHTQY